ncbi:MAG: helix-turn-helix transcriptional regulator [Bacteroidales bacterium]|nr:helix-turn-helix transcriptional regulator [Bacteroidales bacterium]
MKDRIQQFLRSENKPSSKFAEEIGVQPSGVSHVLSGRNKPSLDFILKMLNTYSSLSTDWLLFGKGEMYKNEDTPLLFDDKSSVDSRQDDENYREGNLFKGFDREFDSGRPESWDEKIKSGKYSVSAAGNDTENDRDSAENESIRERVRNHDTDADRDRAISERIIIFYTDGTYREYNPRR